MKISCLNRRLAQICAPCLVFLLAYHLLHLAGARFSDQSLWDMVVIALALFVGEVTILCLTIRQIYDRNLMRLVAAAFGVIVFLNSFLHNLSHGLEGAIVYGGAALVVAILMGLEFLLANVVD